MDLVKQFQDVTGSSEAEAITSLANVDYDLDAAIATFLRSSVPTEDTAMDSIVGGDIPSRSSSTNSSVVRSSRVHDFSLGANTTSAGDENVEVDVGAMLGARGQSISLNQSSVSASEGAGFQSGANTFPIIPSDSLPIFRPSILSRDRNNSPFSILGGAANDLSDGEGGNLLYSIFRPPYDLMLNMDFFFSRDYAKDRDMWLMVNIQDVQNFECQCLNRDVWSNNELKEIIRTHFIFLQYRVDSQDGRKYSQFYKVNRFPYVAILDPRTGELLQTFTSLTSANSQKLLMTFLRQHGKPSVSDAMRESLQNQDIQEVFEVSDSEKPVEDSSFSSQQALLVGKSKVPLALTDEEALKAAIAASLEHQRKNASSGTLSLPGSSTWSASRRQNPKYAPITLSDDDEDDDVGVRMSLVASAGIAASVSVAEGNEDVDIGGGDGGESGDSGESDVDGRDLSDDSVVSLNSPETSPARSTTKTPVESQLRKRKILGHPSSASSQLNLKRLKLEQTSLDSAVAASSNMTSFRRIPSVTGMLEVQEIGPLIPTSSNAASKQYPTELNLLAECSLIGTDADASGGAGSTVKVLLKCPNGERRTINVTDTCTLHSFIAACGSLGYSDILYEFSTNFPRRVLNLLDRKLSLSQLGINANCVVFIESKI